MLAKIALWIPVLTATLYAQSSGRPYVFGKVDLTLATGPSAFVTGDFNGDTRPDLVIINPDSTRYSVILSRVDGSFAPRVDYPLSTPPRRIVSGDFNGDGKLDIAISVSGSILVFAGKGDGTFLAPASSGSITSDSLAVGDFNGDGKLDIAAAEACQPPTGHCTDTEGRLQMLLGKGDGTFRIGGFFPIVAAPFPIASDDFNGDGKLDLAVGSQLNGVSILLGNGDGTFQPRKDFAAKINALVTGDFNGDGKADLALGGLDLMITVYLGQGDGTFQAPVAYATGIINLLTGLTAADFDGDGVTDLAACGNQQISVLLGNPDGTFKTRADYFTSGYAWFAGSADFNGDGHSDLAILNRRTTTSTGPDSVSVLINHGNGEFSGRKDIAVGKEPRSLAAGYFNSDGLRDLAVANYTDGSISILKGGGDGSFTLQQLLPGFTAPTAMGVFNPKSTPSASARPGLTGQPRDRLQISGTGDVTNLEPVTGNELYARGTGITILKGKALGQKPDGRDYDGDGNSDFAVAIPLARTIAVVLCNGDGTCKDPVEYDAGLQPLAVTHGDFNGDGRADLVVADASASMARVFLNNGNGTFRAGVGFTTGTAPQWAAVGDFNGDGHVDVATANNAANTVSVLLGNGDGNLQPRVDYPVSLSPYCVIAGDFSGDGKLDLVVSNSGSGIVSILIGNGDGTFQPSQTLLAGQGAKQIVAADFDGDGTLDLAVANSIDNTVSVFLNPTVTVGTPVLVTVSAANGHSTTVAADSIASAFGKNLATGTATASSADWPAILAGTSITVQDANGVTRVAPIYYASPTQVNFLIPAGTSNGTATVTLTPSGGGQLTAHALVTTVAPGVFALNAAGLVAANVLRVSTGGAQTVETVYQVDAHGAVVARPIDLGPAGDQVYLIVYGTGFRAAGTPSVTAAINNVNAPVSYAGPQTQYPGLDQANILIPRSLAGTGDVALTLTASGIGANIVRLTIK